MIGKTTLIALTLCLTLFTVGCTGLGTDSPASDGDPVSNDSEDLVGTQNGTTDSDTNSGEKEGSDDNQPTDTDETDGNTAASETDSDNTDASSTQSPDSTDETTDAETSNVDDSEANRDTDSPGSDDSDSDTQSTEGNTGSEDTATDQPDEPDVNSDTNTGDEFVPSGDDESSGNDSGSTDADTNEDSTEQDQNQDNSPENSNPNEDPTDESPNEDPEPPEEPPEDPDPPDPGPDLNCANFDDWEEAKATLEDDPSDPHNLDHDSDGIPCEDLPGAPGDSDPTEPEPDPEADINTTLTVTVVDNATGERLDGTVYAAPVGYGLEIPSETTDGTTTMDMPNESEPGGDMYEVALRAEVDGYRVVEGVTTIAIELSRGEDRELTMALVKEEPEPDPNETNQTGSADGNTSNTSAPAV